MLHFIPEKRRAQVNMSAMYSNLYTEFNFFGVKLWADKLHN